MDGMCDTTTLEPPSDRFGNATTGLGIAADVREWRFHFESNFSGAASILLATDGVADDLLPEKRADFLAFFVSKGRPTYCRSSPVAAGPIMSNVSRFQNAK